MDNNRGYLLFAPVFAHVFVNGKQRWSGVNLPSCNAKSGEERIERWILPYSRLTTNMQICLLRLCRLLELLVSNHVLYLLSGYDDDAHHKDDGRCHSEPHHTPVTKESVK